MHENVWVGGQRQDMKHDAVHQNKHPTTHLRYVCNQRDLIEGGWSPVWVRINKHRIPMATRWHKSTKEMFNPNINLLLLPLEQRTHDHNYCRFCHLNGFLCGHVFGQAKEQLYIENDVTHLTGHLRFICVCVCAKLKDDDLRTFIHFLVHPLATYPQFCLFIYQYYYYLCRYPLLPR